MKHEKLLTVGLVIACFFIFVFALYGISKILGSKEVETPKIDKSIMKNTVGTNWDTAAKVGSGLENFGLVKVETKHVGIMQNFLVDVYELPKEKGYLHIEVGYYSDDPDLLMRDLLVWYDESSFDVLREAVSAFGLKTEEDFKFVRDGIGNDEVNVTDYPLDSAKIQMEADAEELGYNIFLEAKNPDSDYVVREEKQDDGSAESSSEANN